jgi:hypothetical protein
MADSWKPSRKEMSIKGIKDEERTEVRIWAKRLTKASQKGKVQRDHNGSQVNQKEQIETFFHTVWISL